MRQILSAILLCTTLSASAQHTAKELFLQAPDSLFPMLSENNRLDLVDLLEAKREAKVKTKFGQEIEMTHLGKTLTRFETSSHSTAQIKLLNDSTLCLIETCCGPAPDSRIAFYNSHWQPLPNALALPHIKDFWTDVPDSLARDAQYAQQSLADITLIEIKANEDNTNLQLTLQTSELAEKEKEAAQTYVQPLVLHWDERAFKR